MACKRTPTHREPKEPIMGDQLTTVDLTALAAGTLVRVTLDNGKTLHLCVTEPASGLVTAYARGLKPTKFSLVNEVGQHVISVGDTFKLGDMPKEVAITSLSTGGGMITASVPGGTPEDLAELAELMQSAGFDVIGYGRADLANVPE